MRFYVPALCLLLWGALLAAGAAAQEYPAKPIRLIVPYAVSGLPDTIARIVGQRAGDAFGQQCVIDNRVGAGGISGTEAVARAPADGYTLLVADVGQLAINPHLYPRLPYDPLKDFAPVSLLGTSALFLVLHPSVPAGNFAELVAYARARPGQLNYGSSGTGSIHHLATEALKSALRLDIVHVPFKGTGQSVPALLGGQLSMLFAALPSIEASVQAGKVRLVGVSTLRRAPQAPDVPTLAELGVAGFDFAPEIGVLAPAGTPTVIVARLSAVLREAVYHPDTVQRFARLGIEPVASTPEAYAERIRAAHARFARVVKESGARID